MVIRSPAIDFVFPDDAAMFLGDRNVGHAFRELIPRSDTLVCF
jgi:hypothetical protein